MNIYIDLDGTLIDVYERYCGILNLYLKNIDSEIFFSTEDYKYYRQSGYSDLKMAMEKGLPSVNENDYRKFKHRFLENLEWLKKDKIIENPKEIKKYGYHLVLITQRRDRKNAFTQIRCLGLNEVFDEIVVLQPIPGQNRKLIYLQDKAKKEDCIIGDSYVELECARKLGMHGFFVTTGLFGAQMVKTEHIGGNYMQCIQFINKNMKQNNI